jgi:hypothetical protein
MSKETAKEQFSKLIKRYMEFKKTNKKINISEETIRTWLNEMLLIFGWDVQKIQMKFGRKKHYQKYIEND